ncbi:MAG: hypothetical protein ACFFDK_07015 [Promethearchaeota archaeon]
MLLQIIEYGINRDIILLLRFFAVLIIFFMAFQVMKKIRETSILSTTTGFGIFLITQALFHYLMAFPHLYPELLPHLMYYIVINALFLCGMYCFIFFTELDEYLHGSIKEKEKNVFLLSIITGIGAPFLGFLVYFHIITIVFVYIFIVVPVIMVTKIFLNKYRSFEIIRRSKIIELFYIGLSLVGFSNFLMVDIFLYYFGIWNILVINSLLIIVGGLLMTWTWSKLPSLSELDWMVKLERLLVIHLKSSRLIYHYEFKLSEISIEGDLISGAFGGFDVILREILSSNGYLKEISHGDKNIIFSHGISTLCILITSSLFSEFKYRLKMFHLSFEKLFGGENLEDWNGQLKPFGKADNLISQFFT